MSCNDSANEANISAPFLNGTICNESRIIDELTWEKDIVRVTFSALGILLAAVIFGANSLVATAYCKFSYVRTVPNILLMNLSSSDLILAPVLVSIHVVNLFFLESPGSRVPCILLCSLAAICLEHQTVSLFLVTLDRWVAVLYPTRRNQILTRNRLAGCIAAQWTLVISANVGVFWLATWSPGTECLMFNVLEFRYLAIVAYPFTMVLLVTMPLFSVSIGVSFVKSRMRTHLTDSGSAQTPSALSPGVSRTLKTLGLILVLTYIAWILPMIAAYATTLRPASYGGRLAQVIFVSSGPLVLASNSVLTPLVYHRTVPAFKQAFDTILGLKTKAQIPIG